MALLPCIAAAVLLLSCTLAAATAPAGTIERVTKQQILASIPPGGHAGPLVLFLTSPSGKYAAYFVRTHTAPGAGGLGADYCFVEVVDTSSAAHGGAGEEGEAATTGTSVWESECRPVSTVNTCALLLSWHGLEVFDGSEEVWHGRTNTDGTNFLQALELVDDGDMRVRDKDGELAWRASDEPRRAQHCGAPGSPGLAAALPPFAEPIGAHSSDLPFGQEHGGNGHAAAELPEAAPLGDGGALGAGYGGVVAPVDGGAGLGGVPPEAGAFGGVDGVAPDAGVVGDDTNGGAAAAAGAGGAYGGAAAAQGGGVAGAAGFGNSQPLVDNSPYDSGAEKDGGRGAHLTAIGVALCVTAALGAMSVGF